MMRRTRFGRTFIPEPEYAGTSLIRSFDYPKWSKLIQFRILSFQQSSLSSDMCKSMNIVGIDALPTDEPNATTFADYTQRLFNAFRNRLQPITDLGVEFVSRMFVPIDENGS